MQIQNYRSRISGPLLDRIDIHIEVPTVRYQDMSSIQRGDASSVIRYRAQNATRPFQGTSARFVQCQHGRQGSAGARGG